MKNLKLHEIIEKNRNGEIEKEAAVKIAGIDVRFKFRKSHNRTGF